MRSFLAIGLLFLLSGCYQSLTWVGPASGVAQGKVSQTMASTLVNYTLKEKTGKDVYQTLFTDTKIDQTVQTVKMKLDPCLQNKLACELISNRIEMFNRKLLVKN